MFEVENLSFSYRIGERTVQVLKNLNFKVNQGDFIGIQGPSGSGKSTLFYILGLLLQPSSGVVRLEGREITDLSSDARTMLRNRKIGFIFQQFHLLARSTVLDNILLPTHYPSELAEPGEAERKKAIGLAEQLGLGNELDRLPNQLSGGQQQRVAIARALMNDVEIILADEPTGNLDSENAAQILDVLSELNRQGKTIVLITHDSVVAQRCTKVFHFSDGVFTRIVENFKPPKGEKKAPPLDSKFEIPSRYSLAIYRRMLRAVLPLAKDNIFRNKVKSLLTMLGVVIGVAAVLAMVTLGEFTKQKILGSYETLGINKLVIWGFPNSALKASDQVTLNFTGFKWENDILPIKRVFPEVRYISPVQVDFESQASAGGRVVARAGTSLGVTPEYLTITNREIQIGTGISPFHVENRSSVCLIGPEIRQELFRHTNPLGEIISVKRRTGDSFPCRVIGVLVSATASNERQVPDLNIILPYTYFQAVIDDYVINEVAIQVAPNSDVELMGTRIKSFLNQRYGKSARIFVSSDSRLIAQMKKFLNIFENLLVVIALLSLVVGGIGINNMMLVSIADRIKEFGLRKALGATHRSIRIQVLFESVALCTVAGLIGVGFGFGCYQLLIYGATHFVPGLQFEWVFEPTAIFLSMISIVGVGIVSGLVPALRAEKLEVIDALRSE